MVLLHVHTGLTRKHGGWMNLESRVLKSSPGSAASARGLRYSTAEELGLLASRRTAREPRSSGEGSEEHRQGAQTQGRRIRHRAGGSDTGQGLQPEDRGPDQS